MADIYLNEGEGCVLASAWRASQAPDAAALDMSGWFLEVFDQSTAIDGKVSVVWTDDSAGAFVVSIDPPGQASPVLRTYTFRLRAVKEGSQPVAPPEFRVIVT